MKSTDNTPAVYSAISKGVYSAFYKGVRPLQVLQVLPCFALRLDGVNTFIQSQNRLINPNGDNTIEFWTPEDFSASRAIISQGITNLTASREFQLFTNSLGQMFMVMGGTSTQIATGVTLGPSTKYGIVQTGNQVQLFLGGVDGTLLRTTTVSDGGAREPTAPTMIGARNSGALNTPVTFYKGLMPDIRINNNYYPLDARNQAIQLAQPDNGNPLTLFNVVPEQWEDIPCNLRKTPTPIWSPPDFRDNSFLDLDTELDLHIELEE